MRKYLAALIVIMLAFALPESNAQEKMKSPPASVAGEIDGVEVEVNYHQPSARGRVMLGEKLPYGKVWRTGANDATTISFSEDVTVEGEELSKGTYSLFTIPGEDSWTIIFNN
ncbi:DUF2911 domain-containing protein, partial [Fulvivirga sp. RKSG066]|uniref:DUF2911 domain-containing protein n=1 Tax=Fulvivirga aurantia TaxID=2529383 RepID=UPI0012BB96C8